MGEFGKSQILAVIGGERIQGGGPLMTVASPADGGEFARGHAASPADVDRAVQEAAGALPELAALGRDARCDLLLRASAELRTRAADLARPLSREQGKPLREARDELDEAVLMLRRVAEDARRLSDPAPPLVDINKRVLLLREPLGVVAAVSPWNFPLLIPIEHIAPALAMGNAVVLKPAETTPLAGLHLVDVLIAAGWPRASLSCLPGGPDVGAALVEHVDVDAVCFTGSPGTGSQVAAAAAGKELVLELGGNGPTMVFADADLQRASSAIASACFYSAGQSCAATERILVHRDVADELAEQLCREADSYQLGDPLCGETVLGPLNNHKVLAKVRGQVAEAVEEGASIRVGGVSDPTRPTDLYFPATVMTDVPPTSGLAREETFGPIAALIPFSDEDEALDIARDGRYGLAASVWTRDISRALRVAEALPNGNVNVNDHSNYWESSLPFGGAPRRGSGLGRVGGEWILRRLSTLKTITLDTR